MSRRNRSYLVSCDDTYSICLRTDILTNSDGTCRGRFAFSRGGDEVISITGSGRFSSRRFFSSRSAFVRKKSGVVMISFLEERCFFDGDSSRLPSGISMTSHISFVGDGFDYASDPSMIYPLALHSISLQSCPPSSAPPSPLLTWGGKWGRFGAFAICHSILSTIQLFILSKQLPIHPMESSAKRRETSRLSRRRLFQRSSSAFPQTRRKEVSNKHEMITS